MGRAATPAITPVIQAGVLSCTHNDGGQGAPRAARHSRKPEIVPALGLPLAAGPEFIFQGPSPARFQA